MCRLQSIVWSRSLWRLSAKAGNNEVVSYSILAFAPGELSTIEQPAWVRGNVPRSLVKSFNVADLPCPPRDVMVCSPDLNWKDGC